MRKKKRIDRQDYLTDYVIVEEIRALHEKYIKLFGDLRTHFSIVDDDFYIAAQKALTDQYESELALMYEQAKSKTLGKFYLAESVNNVLRIYSQRKRLKWYKRGEWVDSDAKQILDAQIGEAAAGILSELVGKNDVEKDKEEYNADFENQVDGLIKTISEEFTTRFKRNRFVKKNSKYLTWLLSVYAQKSSADEIYSMLVIRFVKEKKHEDFNEQHEEYIKGLLDEFLQNFSEPEEEPEPEEVSEEEREAEELGNLDELEALEEELAEEPAEEKPAGAPEGKQNAINGATDVKGEEIEEEIAAEEPGDLNELKALEEELAEEPAKEEVAGEPEKAEQLKIAVPEEPAKAEPPKLSLMLIPQTLPWEIALREVQKSKQNNAAKENKVVAEQKAVEEKPKDEPIQNIVEGG